MTPAELIEIRKQGMKPKKEIVISLLKRNALEGDDRPIIEVGDLDGLDWRGLLGLEPRILFHSRLDDALKIAAEIAPLCRNFYFGNVKDNILIWVRGGRKCLRLL